MFRTDRLQGGIVWLTGLSGAGKSTLAKLVAAGVRRDATEILDADEMRKTISQGLGYSRADREANVQRIAHVARLLAKHGVLVIVAAISPYRATRDELRRLSGDAGHPFLEVFVDAPLDVVERRDVKGLYAKARASNLASFTGISDPYEPPDAADIVVHTDVGSPAECANAIIRVLVQRGLAASADAG